MDDLSSPGPSGNTENTDHNSLRQELASLRESVQLLIKEKAASKRERSKSPTNSPSVPKTKQTKHTHTQCLTLWTICAFLNEEEFVEEEEDCIKELEEFFGDSNKVGEKNTKLADIINSGVLGNSLDEAKLKSICEKYPTTGNCRHITVPKTNKEVWKNLSKHQRLRDSSFQKAQTIVSKSLNASLKLLDVVRKGKKEKTTIDHKFVEGTIGDILRLNTCLFKDLSEIRRCAIRPGLSAEYQALCGGDDNSSSNDLLFGSNLSQRLKDLRESA
ncbi:reverse transcriptase and recombinase [Elysia marginata]|uniref:Reverse transcriptase and recombinase n=1 Tax=Elysia marginata TaxID=1093978 RepID=A0AAV4G3X7_9GAST|nr:reverse transcriptase and recombinase [Elysia marginata]